MADNLTPPQRKRNMANIRSRHTKPELVPKFDLSCRSHRSLRICDYCSPGTRVPNFPRCPFRLLRSEKYVRLKKGLKKIQAVIGNIRNVFWLFFQLCYELMRKPSYDLRWNNLKLLHYFTHALVSDIGNFDSIFESFDV